MPVLIVSDSRGGGLQTRLDSLAPGVFEVHIFSGKGFRVLFNEAENLLEHRQYNTLYIIGGICSITKKDLNKKVTLRDLDPSNTCKVIKKQVQQGLKKLHVKFPTLKIIIPTTVGIDLAKYNQEPFDKETQTILNFTVTKVNAMLVKTNDQGIAFPWISKYVHRCKGKGRWAHKYSNLHDGCHFSKKMKNHCAQMIVKSIVKM